MLLLLPQDNIIPSSMQHIHDLPPNRQAQIWNNCKMEKTIKPSIFKAKDKPRIFDEYNEEIEQLKK